MKLRNKLAAITAASMLAFAGIGFAAWTFTQERAAEVSVTDKVSVGIELNDNFKLYNADDDAEISSLYLICDAPTGKTFVLGGEGVYWASDAAGITKVDDVYLKGTLLKEEEDGILNKSEVTVSFTASHSLTSNYVTFGAFSAIADATVTVANNANVQSADFNLPTVSYKDAALPQSVEELTDMNTALGTELSGAVLSFTAQITD